MPRNRPSVLVIGAAGSRAQRARMMAALLHAVCDVEVVPSPSRGRPLHVTAGPWAPLEVGFVPPPPAHGPARKGRGGKIKRW